MKKRKRYKIPLIKQGKWEEGSRDGQETSFKRVFDKGKKRSLSIEDRNPLLSEETPLKTRKRMDLLGENPRRRTLKYK